MIASVLAGLAGIAAKRHNWDEYERRFGQLLDALEQSGNIDADFARVMRVAADEAETQRRGELAIRALELAESQLSELGLDDDLEQVRERLDELRRASTS